MKHGIRLPKTQVDVALGRQLWLANTPAKEIAKLLTADLAARGITQIVTTANVCTFATRENWPLRKGTRKFRGNNRTKPGVAMPALLTVECGCGARYQLEKERVAAGERLSCSDHRLRSQMAQQRSTYAIEQVARRHELIEWE